MTKSSRVRRTVIEQSTVAVKQCVCADNVTRSLSDLRDPYA